MADDRVEVVDAAQAAGTGPASDALALSETGKLNVFISYSRDDLAFADQLDATLGLIGFSTVLDRHGIQAGEDWRTQLRGLISEADTVVFVLTPFSATSEVCAWEVEEARHMSKRILPVVPRSLDGASAPPGLAALNYILFYADPKKPGSGFRSGLLDLVSALKTDLGWLREHTRLMLRASEWDSGARANNRLLSGADIAAAKSWAARKPKSAPDLTALHLDFIRASEEGEALRASAERKRLDEIANAQVERARALEATEIAQRDRAATLHELENALLAAADAQRKRARGGPVLAAALLLGVCILPTISLDANTEHNILLLKGISRVLLGLSVATLIASIVATDERVSQQEAPPWALYTAAGCLAALLYLIIIALPWFYEFGIGMRGIWLNLPFVVTPFLVTVAMCFLPRLPYSGIKRAHPGFVPFLAGRFLDGAVIGLVALIGYGAGILLQGTVFPNIWRSVALMALCGFLMGALFLTGIRRGAQAPLASR